jgi:hypothetical protein
MDKITHEVRLTRWTRLVEQCQSRPEGQTIAQWCKEAGIGEKTYYYWQRRVRLHCAAQIARELPATRTESNEVSFAEVKFSSNRLGEAMEPPVQEPSTSLQPDVFIRRGERHYRKSV